MIRRPNDPPDLPWVSKHRPAPSRKNPEHCAGVGDSIGISVPRRQSPRRRVIGNLTKGIEVGRDQTSDPLFVLEFGRQSPRRVLDDIEAGHASLGGRPGRLDAPQLRDHPPIERAHRLVVGSDGGAELAPDLGERLDEDRQPAMKLAANLSDLPRGFAMSSWREP